MVPAMSEQVGSAPPLDRAPGLSWDSVAELIRLRNQTGTLLLLLPTLWSLMLATAGHPPLPLIVIFSIGAFVMRSAGVILNDLADRQIDRQVARTRTRPLASGRISPTQAGVVLAILLLVATLLVAQLSSLTIILSPIALLLAAIYPYAKRFIEIPQAALGMAFGWGVIMAWAASRNTLDLTAWLLFGGTICWALAYDTIYAVQDRDDDYRIGVKSAAVFFGRQTPLAIGGFMLGMLACLALAGASAEVGWAYYLALAAVAGAFARQIIRLHHPTLAPDGALTMFKEHVWVGLMILLGMWASL